MPFKYLESMGVMGQSRCNPFVCLRRLCSMHICCVYTCISVYSVLARPSLCGGKGGLTSGCLPQSLPTLVVETGWPGSLQDLPVSTFPLTNAAEWDVPASLLTLILGTGAQVLVLCVASPSFTESLPQTLCNRKASQLLFCSHPTQASTHRTFQAIVCEQK